MLAFTSGGFGRSADGDLVMVGQLAALARLFEGAAVAIANR